jgi:ribonucleoside-diphosphate reductase alpha chain
MDNNELIEVNPWFEAVAREKGFYSPELMDLISRTGTIAEIDDIPEAIRKVFVTAHDVPPEWHIRMQAAFQQFTDNAVSKTVNLPQSAGVEEVQAIYDLAFRLGCKGVTIYRDGSKDNQVLSFTSTTKNGGPVIDIRERPETLEGFTTKMNTGMGQLYVTVTELDGRPFEVFATIGKSGKSTTAKTEAIGRLISLALRSGVDVADIIEQVKGICGEHAVFQKGGAVLSIPDAIGRVLEKRYKNRMVKHPTKTSHSLKADICPDCKGPLTFEESCMICHACGFSKCG